MGGPINRFQGQTDSEIDNVGDFDPALTHKCFRHNLAPDLTMDFWSVLHKIGNVVKFSLFTF